MNLIRALRFSLVGGVATVIYFCVTALFGNPPLSLDPNIANLMGFLASISVSYIGHHSFTFGITGAHSFYGPRYLITAAVLFLMSVVVMSAMRYGLALDHTLATAVVAVSYPVASFAMNGLWTFIGAPRQE